MLWFNGQFADESTVSATNAGSLLGWGVFTTLGIWNAKPFAFDLHLARLKHDAARANIEYSNEDEILRAALDEVIARQKIVRGMARITITKRGDGRWNTQSGSDVSIVARPMSDEIPLAKLTVSPFRVHSGRALAGVKSTSYLDYQLAWNEANGRGFDEAILLNEHQQICEAARANIFWTRDGEMFTPSLQTGCLPGIARRLVWEWAQEIRIASHEIEYSIEHLRDADGIFLTSAATGVREVSVFEQRDLTNNGLTNNEVIAQVQNRWREAVNDRSFAG